MDRVHGRAEAMGKTGKLTRWLCYAAFIGLGLLLGLIMLIEAMF